MAKRTKNIEEISTEKESKSSTKLLIVMLSILIPLLAISAVFLIIAQITEVNVFDKAKELTSKLPLINDQKEEDVDTNDLILGDRVVTLQADIQEKEAQLVKLQKELDGSANEKQALLQKQEDLQSEIEVLQREKNDTKRDFAGIISTFEKMSAKSAAPILTEMSDEEAIRILTNMKPDILAAILEKMTPQDAAKYTSKMAN